MKRRLFGDRVRSVQNVKVRKSKGGQNDVDTVTVSLAAAWLGAAALQRGSVAAERCGGASRSGGPLRAAHSTIPAKPSSAGISGSLFTKSPRRARSGNWRLCSFTLGFDALLNCASVAAPSDYYSHNQRCAHGFRLI